jgi:hypothetical protein
MENTVRRGLIPALLAFSIAGAPFAASGVTGEDDESVDFSDLATPTCEVEDLVALPPVGWISVPIEGLPEGMAGCQMMRLDGAQQLLGIARLRSTAAGENAPGEESFGQIVATEMVILEQMGYRVGDPLWSRQDVPIRGAGFSNARAVGLPATIEQSTIPQEVHLLVFQSATVQYLVTLLTPAKDAEPAIYERNTADFGILIRTLDQPTAGR